MAFRYIVPVLLSIASAAQAQTSMPATTRADMNALTILAQRYPDAAKLTEETQGYYPTALIHGRCMVGFLGKVNSAFEHGQEQGGPVRWGSRTGNIISFRVDARHLEVVNDLQGVDYAELAGKAAPNLDLAVRSIHADSVHRGIDLPQSYTGKDVLIGITDWGFDYTHPMFYDTLLQETRVRAAWDQYRQAGPAPTDFGYGTELTTAEDLLATQADTSNIYSFATHGSHVAGIAGGSGAGTDYRGVAFESQFLFCTFLVDAAAVLDAFNWMKGIADQDDKRLVVNMSWGLYYIGTLDGNSLISQAIDQLSEQGVVFCNSGGNNGDVFFHIKKDFTADTLRSRVQFYPYSAHPKMWGQSLTMWGGTGEAFSAGFAITNSVGQTLQETPWYNTATQQAYLDSSIIQGNDTVYFNLTAEAAHPLNGRPHFRLRIKNRSNSLKILMKATAESGTVHFWNLVELSNGVGNWGQAFQAPQPGWTQGDAQYGISEPACTRSLITVAAYNSDYFSSTGEQFGGELAWFSSNGPTLDERVKPDIAAPGVNVASSISSFTDDDFTEIASVEFQGRDYPFARFSGTSMAGPATAGTVALMLEADPSLTPAQAKEIIKLTARTDDDTGVIPEGGSTRWGMGKLNAYRAVKDYLGVAGVDEDAIGDARIWPNPVSALLNVSVPEGRGQVRYSIMDITGRTVHTGSRVGAGIIAIPVKNWPAGVYLLHLEQDGHRSVRRFVKE
ncbi:MAG: S8 family peptidase [Flavobacteriales bacterium]|nr:S8 family peptidase [Flavobacteriales bacterium]